MDLERIVADRHVRPDVRHQVILGDDLTCRLDKSLNNIEGAAAQRDRLPARTQLAPSEVDLPCPGLIGQRALHSHQQPLFGRLKLS